MSAYEIHRELRFTVCDEEIAITACSEFRMQVEETRKNGQEDTHMAGELVHRDGKWEWAADWGRGAFDQYGNDGLGDAIPDYLNANPPPADFFDRA